MEESNGGGVSGEYPEYGAIFMSSNSTRKESLRRGIFGLPSRQAGFVKQIKAGMMLFLFEFESRELHGVFQACSDGAINIDPDAFCSSGKQFSAQVKFVEKWHCRPLREMEFRHAICENYFTGTKFNFGLSQAQVHRLLKLFSFKKVDTSQQMKPAVAKATRKYDSSLGNTAGDRSFRNRCAEDTDGDDDCEFSFRATSAGDLLGHRLTENNGFWDESDIGVETTEKGYSGEASRIYRRHVDPKLHRSKDRVGYEFSMNNSSRTDGVTNYSDYYNANDRSDPNILRHPASGWPENENREEDGFTQAISRSNLKEHLNFEVDPVVNAQRSVPLESRYGINTEYYDPCEPGIVGYATMKSYRHDTDYYTSVPTEHHEYQTITGRTGVVCSESESESRYDRLRHSQHLGFLASAGATEKIRNSESLSYSRHNNSPSFAYPLSSRDLSPKDRVDYKSSTYQLASYTKDRVDRNSRIHPSFTYPSKSGDKYRENRTQNKVQAYQRHDDSSGYSFDSNNRMIRKVDIVNSDELERKRTKKSVFRRLALPSKEHEDGKDSSPDTESVDEVMAYLNGCQKYWTEKKRPNLANHGSFGKPKKMMEKIHTKEVLDKDLMLPVTETSPNDLLDRGESMEHSDKMRPFIDFKRRSKAQNILGSPTQGFSEDSHGHSAPQNRKRKLMRPKLNEDDSEKKRGNDDNPTGNVLASQSSASEVPVHDLLGHGDQ
ncbi:unnamed protein product [Cochlearia groenlandica]